MPTELTWHWWAGLGVWACASLWFHTIVNSSGFEHAPERAIRRVYLVDAVGLLYVAFIFLWFAPTNWRIPNETISRGIGGLFLFAAAACVRISLVGRIGFLRRDLERSSKPMIEWGEADSRDGIPPKERYRRMMGKPPADGTGPRR